jgi:hypothetical protein
MSTNDKPAYRPAHFVGHSEDGTQAVFESTTTPESDTCRTLIVCRPDKVVPIVFVPGIMGSNLKAKVNIKNADGMKTVVKANDPIWRVDGIGSMLNWLTKGADEYQLRLRHGVVAVDNNGMIPKKGLQCQAPQNSAMAPIPLSEQDLRKRGWGEVSAKFYLPFLDWLEHSLNFAGKDFSRQDWPDNVVLQSLKQVHTGPSPLGAVTGSVPGLNERDLELLLDCDNPVHAFGYNWLQSNAKSGEELKARIDEIIKHYKAQGKQCEKVILVTHSMGGLVARAACKLHGMEGKVAGVFHGVMPTDGAAASYKRMVSGFGGEGGGLFSWLTTLVLGPRGNFTTPTLALNTGPLELLPNKRYNGGKPWLFVKDAEGQKLALPKPGGDPYSEIYTEDKLWWKPCNEAWMNPAGLENAAGFKDYGRAVERAGAFHDDLHAAGDFHAVTHAHYGQDDSRRAYGQVTWSLNRALTPEQHAALQRHDLNDADMGIALSAGTGATAIKVRARLSEPDVPGDGTVPAQASASRVKDAGHSGVLVSGTGYDHDASFKPGDSSEGPKAALHAVLHILKTTGAGA